jgi:hypothetical protein
VEVEITNVVSGRADIQSKIEQRRSRTADEPRGFEDPILLELKSEMQILTIREQQLRSKEHQLRTEKQKLRDQLILQPAQEKGDFPILIDSYFSPFSDFWFSVHSRFWGRYARYYVQ